MKISIILLAVLAIIIGCCDTTSPSSENSNTYFPFGNNYKWTYERIYNTYDENDSLLVDTIVDNVSFQLIISDTLNGFNVYTFEREMYYNDEIFRDGDNIYSATSSDSLKIYWKSDFELHYKWDYSVNGQSYGKPPYFFTMYNEIVGLDETIYIQNIEYKNCIVVKRNYITMINSNEEILYYAKGIGLVF